MLLTETQSTAISWALGGVVILAGLGLGFWLRRGGRPGGGMAVAVFALAGYIIAISRFANGTPVLVMRGDEAGFVRTDHRLYGTTTYAYANGQSDDLHWMAARHLIVNDTPRTLKLRTVRYGFGAVSGTEDIAPYRRRELKGRLRHFGPGDPPPGRIDTGEWERYWLFW
jgi:hypothetical protein